MEEWVDEDNFGPAITEEDTHISANKNSRVVVLKHMFTLKELEEDPSLLLDLKEDVREECETMGEVEPDGVITVKFRDPISAQACVVVRFFIVSRATYVAYVEPPQKCRKCKVAFFPDARLKHRCGSAGNISGVAVSQRTSRKSGGKKVKRSDWTPLPIGCLRKATELV